MMGMEEEAKHLLLKTCSCMMSSKCSPEVTQTCTGPVLSEPWSKYRNLGIIFSAAGNKQQHKIKLISFSLSSSFISYVPLSYVHDVIYRFIIK